MGVFFRCQLQGNLGGDAEVRDIGNDRSVISFSVAVTERWKAANGEKQEKTTWVRCSLWRKTGNTSVAQYLKKGQGVIVEGTPSARAYMLDGHAEPKASLEVTVQDLHFVGGARTESAPAGMPVNNASPKPQAHQQQQAVIPPPVYSQTMTADLDEDLPF